MTPQTESNLGEGSLPPAFCTARTSTVHWGSAAGVAEGVHGAGGQLQVWGPLPRLWCSLPPDFSQSMAESGCGLRQDTGLCRTASWENQPSLGADALSSPPAAVLCDLDEGLCFFRPQLHPP